MACANTQTISLYHFFGTGTSMFLAEAKNASTACATISVFIVEGIRNIFDALVILLPAKKLLRLNYFFYMLENTIHQITNRQFFILFCQACCRLYHCNMQN